MNDKIHVCHLWCFLFDVDIASTRFPYLWLEKLKSSFAVLPLRRKKTWKSYKSEVFNYHTLVATSWKKYPCEGNWEHSMLLHVIQVLTWEQNQVYENWQYLYLKLDFRQIMFCCYWTFSTFWIKHYFGRLKLLK